MARLPAVQSAEVWDPPWDARRNADAIRFGIQHCRQLHNEYELASLSRRGHPELLCTNGGNLRTKLHAAAAGMAVAIAMIRGFVRQSQGRLGNFWIDLTRSIVYVLLPLSFLAALWIVLARRHSEFAFLPDYQDS